MQMNNCSQRLCFQLHCNCCHQQPSTSAPQQNNDRLQGLYSKFAVTLEQELRNQHEKYAEEIDSLNDHVFTLQNNATKTDLRNKRDLQALEQLRREYNLLLQRIRNQDQRVVKEVEVVQKIREVTVEIESQELLDEVRVWKRKADENNKELQRVKMEKVLLQQENTNIGGELQRLKKTIKKLEQTIQQLTRTVSSKDLIIDKSNQNIQYLKNNREVVTQTKHLFPQFRPSDKVRTQNKVQTIYIEKPVQKLVFVDVKKTVRSFVEPQRPVVNRIINCQPKSTCKCSEEQADTFAYKTEISNLHNCIDELQGNVASYKAERGRLVDVIGSKDSELNYLQSKMKLYGAQTGPVRGNSGSSINVMVSRVKNQAPTSQKVVNKTQTNNRKK